jgi:hypothetical protein
MYKCSHACSKTEHTSLIKYNKKVNTVGSYNNAMENKREATSCRFQYNETYINKIIFQEIVLLCSQSKFFLQQNVLTETHMNTVYNNGNYSKL